MYPGLIPLMDYAGAKGFESITVFTNATILTDELIDCLLRNNVTVRFSLYGHTARIHDAHTTNTRWYGKFAVTETGAVILGDCGKQSVKEILESEAIKKYWFLTLNQVKIYQDCEFKYSCRLPVPGHSAERRPVG